MNYLLIFKRLACRKNCFYFKITFVFFMKGKCVVNFKWVLCRSTKIPGEMFLIRKLGGLKILNNYLTPVASLQFTRTTSYDNTHIYNITLVNLFVKHCPGNCNLKAWKRQERYFLQQHHKWIFVLKYKQSKNIIQTKK